MLRTNTCGELRNEDKDKEVELCGWVHSRRDHGGVIFIDLRDRYGLTQIVFNPEVSKKTHKKAEKLRREDVIRVKGTVKPRDKELINKDLETGEIEVFIKDLEILNAAMVPPMEVDEHKIPNDDVRLRYRYLDLRRPSMQDNLLKRHEAAQAAREFLNKQNFMEVETPLLIRSTPEGARDYVVPSRINPGSFYSLPQSPQLYKQILMVSGVDKYYQLARCLRDEDLREDRQPEFTQIDIEMSFVEEGDVLSLAEEMLKHIWKKVLGNELKTPFPRITYKEAMEKYGTDRPDTRFGLELKNVSEIVKEGDFKVFKEIVKEGGLVKGLTVKKSSLSRKQIDEYINYAQELGSSGLAWMKMTKDGLESNIVKFFSEEVQEKLVKKMEAEAGDLLMFIADKNPKTVNDVLSRIRLKLGKELDLIKDEFNFVWVVDFPLYKKDEGRWAPMHHIFSMPKDKFVGKLKEDPGKVTGKLYDIVLNGIEIGGGSIRIHKKEIQEEALEVIGMSYEEAKERFGFLLEAFKYGAPPHGGIAFGFDRLVALMQGGNDIREVIAFPKTKAGENPMDGCPTPIDEEQMKELHIKLDEVAKEKLKDES